MKKKGVSIEDQIQVVQLLNFPFGDCVVAQVGKLSKYFKLVCTINFIVMQMHVVPVFWA